MRYISVSLFAALLFLVSCKKERPVTGHPADPPVTAPSPVLIKDITVSHLPSPYYHFEYDASGRVSLVSFASDFTRYDVVYNAGRIVEMRNTILVNKDRLKFVYNNAGQVKLIQYADSTGRVYKNVVLFYEGSRLTRLERSRIAGGRLILEKDIKMTYFPDGNLSDITYHYPTSEGQPQELSHTIHFEQYDDKFNPEGFSLLHEEFFDHLVLLPGVILQKNNPGKETLTGVAETYTAQYAYTYNDKKAPVTKTGDLLFLTGSHTGQHFPLLTTYTYH